jgi:very-short-patch-repair endonuclease
MTYSNQRDHKLLDRQAIRGLLWQFTQAQVLTAPAELTRTELLQRLQRLADSDLEREWLRYLDARGHHLPSHAQTLIEVCRTRPDFLYQDRQVAIYIDGPHHAYPERQARDKAQSECMDDQGYTVIRFGIAEDWGKIIAQFPSVFGRAQ